MRPIILIGYMGAGKTTVGRLLAEQLSYSFLDTDGMIEAQERRSIRTIFEMDGEERFRDMETALLEKLLEENLEDVVLSVGGGLPVRDKNRELLCSKGDNSRTCGRFGGSPAASGTAYVREGGADVRDKRSALSSGGVCSGKNRWKSSAADRAGDRAKCRYGT